MDKLEWLYEFKEFMDGIGLWDRYSMNVEKTDGFDTPYKLLVEVDPDAYILCAFDFDKDVLVNWGKVKELWWETMSDIIDKRRGE